MIDQKIIEHLQDRGEVHRGTTNGADSPNIEKKALRCGLDVGGGVQLKKVKVTSYIAQYQFLRKCVNL